MWRSRCRRSVNGVNVVFDGDRDAVKRTGQCIALLEAPVKSLGLSDCIRIQGDKCIQRCSSCEAEIIFFDPIKIALDELFAIDCSLLNRSMDGFNGRGLDSKVPASSRVGHCLLSEQAGRAESQCKPCCLIDDLRSSGMAHR